MRYHLIAALALAPMAAAADEMKAMRVADELGTLLAAESFCGLTYDQAAIEAFIDAQDLAAHMGFISELAMMTQGAEYTQRDFGPSARTAHCRAVTLTARHHGFID